jgi:hypothetical protein
VHHFKSFAHVAGLRAIAVAQRVVHLLATSPEFVVAHRPDLLDILLVTAVIAVAPPLAMLE